MKWLLLKWKYRHIRKHAYRYVSNQPYAIFGPPESYQAYLAWREARDILER